jgi:hypothetical protein
MNNIMKLTIMLLLVTAFFLISLSPAFSANFTKVNETIIILSGPLGLSSNGSISIPVDKLQLNGEDYKVQAASAPSFVLQDATGTQGGWELTFQASDLVDNRSKNRISAANFKFRPSPAATVIKLTGQPIDSVNGPKEMEENELPLNVPQKIVTSTNGFGRGRYLFVTHPSSFVQEFPADMLAGNYSGTLTATLFNKP